MMMRLLTVLLLSVLVAQQCLGHGYNDASSDDDDYGDDSYDQSDSKTYDSQDNEDEDREDWGQSYHTHDWHYKHRQSPSPCSEKSKSPSPSPSAPCPKSPSASPSPTCPKKVSPSPSTMVPSRSASPSPSTSISPSSSPSSSPSASIVPSTSPSVSPSTSPSPSSSFSPSPSPSSTPSPSPSTTPSATPSPSRSPTSSPSTSISPILSTPGPSPLASASPSASVCPQPLLGSAQGFSAFVLGNAATASNASALVLDMANGDFEAKAAANGGVRLRRFGVFANSPCTAEASQQSTLVVTGTVDFSGQLFCGNLMVSNTSSVLNLPSFNTGNSLVVGNEIDFAAVGANLTEVSASLCQVDSRPADTTIFGDVRLLASGGSTEVFSVDVSTLARTGFMRLVGASPSVTSVIINVLGNGTASFTNFFFDTGGVPAGLFTWNICSADRVSIQNFQFPGTLLAPQAAVTLENSQVQGAVVAATLAGAGGGQINVALCP